jgi:hypothetical protein
MNDICFWSIGDGKYAPVLQSLVYSFRQVGMKEDFHAISDRPIKGAITHIVPPFNKGPHFHFKYAFLVSHMRKLNYRYFVYLDSDNFFVRKPPDLRPLVGDLPFVCFLESDCLSPLVKVKTWTHVPLSSYVSVMREMGITDSKIYNVNGGFFIVKKEAISDLYKAMYEFWYCGTKFMSPMNTLWPMPCKKYQAFMNVCCFLTTPLYGRPIGVDNLIIAFLTNVSGPSTII